MVARLIGVALGTACGLVLALILISLLGAGGAGRAGPGHSGAADDGPECTSRAGCGW